MAYLIYRTDFANTIVRESATNTASGGTEQSILKSLITPLFIIPDTQPIYYWKIILPTTATPNDETHISLWEKRIEIPPNSDALATVGFVTGLTTVINNNITYISGVTDTKLNASIFTGYTATTGLQQVTQIGANTNIESTFSGGLVVNKIRPTGNTTTAIQVHKADGITNIINVDTVSGFTGFGTITPKTQIHTYGTDDLIGNSWNYQTNGLRVDGAFDVDKDIQWATEGNPAFTAQIFRGEEGKYWYLSSPQYEINQLTISRGGRVGINNQTNYLDYHAILTSGGPNDIHTDGTFDQNQTIVYEIQINNVTGLTDTFVWRTSIDQGFNFGSWSISSGCTTTFVELSFGVTVKFENLTGHTLGTSWLFGGFSQEPIGTFVVSPNPFIEVQQTVNYTANPIIYEDVTGSANNGTNGLDIQMFNTGTTLNAMYFGALDQFTNIFVHLKNFGSGVLLLVQYYNGNSWVNMTQTDQLLFDDTKNLTQSGNVSWDTALMPDWVSTYMPNLVESGYLLHWIRLITSTTPSIIPIAKSFMRNGAYRFALYSSANDFSPKFYIDSLGKVNVGGGNMTGSNLLQINSGRNSPVVSSGTDSLVEFDSEDSSVVDLKMKLSSNDNIPPAITFIKTRGTLDSPNDTLTGDKLGALKFKSRFNNTGRLITEIGAQFTGSGSTKCGDVYINTANGSNPVEVIRINYMGNTGFGVNPTAVIHIKSGSTTNAQLKFDGGNLLTIPQAGVIEHCNDAWYGTITTGVARKTFAFLENPQFSGNVELPNTTCLNNTNLCNYILQSGGTNNNTLYKTCNFNIYSGNTQPTINIAITGASNGLSKSGLHDIKFGGLLTEDTTVGAGGKNFTLCAKRFTIASHNGTDIYDALGNNVNIYSSGGTVTLYGKTSGGTEAIRFIINQSQATFTDSRIVPRGIEYNGDYSGTYNAHSLVDKSYVDSIATGLIVKQSTLVATTANISLSGLLTIDNIVLKNGNRVLVKDQNTGSQNGIYVASSTTWNRAVDYDFSPLGEIANGNLIPVSSGNTNGNTIWVLTTADPIVSGDTLSFSLFSKTSAIIAGNGICTTQTSGNYNVSVKLANNCGLCSDASGLYVNSAIAGIGLNYSTGILNVCGSGLAGNSILWSGNTFNVNPATGILNTALNTKLNTSVYQTYTGTTASAISSKLSISIFNSYTGTTAPNQFIAHSLFDNYTGTTAPNQFVNNSLFNNYTGATKTVLSNKAFLSGATFSGVLRAPKPNINDNSTCVATTSWYIGQASSANPIMNGIVCIGISNLFARQDHIHPSDTSRLAVNVFTGYTGTTVPNTYAPKASPTFTGVVTMPTPFTLGAVSVKTTGTELNYVTGVTSNIQSQINSKVSSVSPTFTGTVTIPTPFVLGAISVVATGTVINYLTGTTSNIQLQLNAKAPIISPTFTVSARSVTPIVNDNNTCVATTAWYFGQGGTSNPLMNGIATSGTSTCWSRQNHVHPIDTSRLATNSFNTYSGTTVPNTYTTISKFNTYTGTTVPNTYAPKASPTFTGVVTMPTPFTLGAISVVATGTVMNYLTGTTSNIQTQINSKTDKTKTIVTLTGNTTINATYADKLIEANGTFTITMPNSMATGMRLDIINIGTGAITLAASTTINAKGGNLRITAQWAGASVYHRGSNIWLAVGDLTA